MVVALSRNIVTVERIIKGTGRYIRTQGGLVRPGSLGLENGNQPPEWSILFALGLGIL